MATYSALVLTGSTNGKPIAVAATASPGTTVHTAIAGTSGYDEVYLWASNVTGAAAKLTVEFGGVTTADLLVKELSIPANSEPLPIAVGQRINGGSVVRAYSDVSNAINITGNVNRIQ